MIDILLNPRLWFPSAILVAIAATLVLIRRQATLAVPARARVLGALNLFYGVVIGVMALGHVAAVSTKMALGTLPPTTTWFALPLGFVLGVPAWWLAIDALRLATGRKRTLVLNLSLAAVFVALVTSAPLAVPALLNVGYQLHTRRAVGIAMGTLAAATYLAMFIASFVVTRSF